MPRDGRVPEATELVYLPEPSWLPPLVALGIALVLLGLTAGWFYTAIGGILALTGLRLWLRRNRDSIASLPREQHPVSAPLQPRS